MTDTPDTLREKLAAIAARHQYAPDGRKCACEFSCAELLDYPVSPWHRHFADAILAAPGIAVVALPEPRGDYWPALIGGEPESVYLTDDGDENVVVVSGCLRVYADEARALAAALIAAADKAEEGR